VVEHSTADREVPGSIPDAPLLFLQTQLFSSAFLNLGGRQILLKGRQSLPELFYHYILIVVCSIPGLRKI
jgi:hypothetical protein